MDFTVVDGATENVSIQVAASVPDRCERAETGEIDLVASLVEGLDYIAREAAEVSEDVVEVVVLPFTDTKETMDNYSGIIVLNCFFHCDSSNTIFARILFTDVKP